MTLLLQGPNFSSKPKEPLLLEPVRAAMRCKHDSFRTERSDDTPLRPRESPGGGAPP